MLKDCLANNICVSHSEPSSLNSELQTFTHELPINEDGFYAPPFDVAEGDTLSQRILLLGDSFTLGHSASALRNTFAAILDRKGFSVFSTGLSGADVTQYEVVLNEHLKDVKPQFVILNLFLGNDLTSCERPSFPGVPPTFNTTAGNVLSLQNGNQFYNYKLAYQPAISHLLIPQCSKLNTWMAKSRITSIIWKLMSANGIISPCSHVEEHLDIDVSLTNKQLCRMVNFCEARGVDMIISVIPELKDGSLIFANDYPGLFNEIKYYELNVNPEMYDQGDGHFNDKGHAYYADFLQSLIE